MWGLTVDVSRRQNPTSTDRIRKLQTMYKTIIRLTGSRPNNNERSILTLKVLKYFYINQETKGFFQFEVIIHVLVCSFCFFWSLNLPLSSSSTTSRELLSQLSTCSEWRWLEVGGKWKKYIVFIKTDTWTFSFHTNPFHAALRPQPGLCMYVQL